MDDRLSLVERYFEAAGLGVTQTDATRPDSDPFYLSVARRR